MLRGNKGEWSEAYAFLYILKEGKLYASDQHLNIADYDQYLPVIKIIREEEPGDVIDYYCGDVIEIEKDDRVIKTIDPGNVAAAADDVLKELKSSDTGTIAIPSIEIFLENMHVTKLKAPSKDKADITLQIWDSHTSSQPVCGWSIKSELGSPATLLNAGRTTNFKFEVQGACPDEINAIDTRSKVKDRVNAILNSGKLLYRGMENTTFQRNLRLVDTLFPNIMAEALISFYSGKASPCRDIVDILETEDPLSLGSGMYRYKFKKFLASVALGMVPATEWDGHDAATGGYLVVNTQGDVVAFHVYNRDDFEEYLLNTTRLETASTSRHGFGEVYTKDGENYIDLNLQIRFK